MRTKFILNIVFLSLTGLCSSAKKDIKYPINEIPVELKSNAKAVIRLEEREFILTSDSKATEKITLAISILNENGYPHAKFQQFYNKFIRIHDIKAIVYSANGEKLHRIKQDDILDVSATTGFSVYDDNRVKTFNPKTKDYPFTIEYSFTKEYIGIFSFPIWHLFKDYNVSVEKAIFRIKTTDPNTIRIKQRNINQEATEKIDDGYWTQSWDFTNFEARIEEPFCQHIIEYTPIIQLAPTDINIKGNKGKCNTWKQYGSFISTLNEGRNTLPEETYKEVIDLTKNASSEYEKVKLIYEYMQNKTRYVSIQVGMGGWQPSEANTVDRLGYGDCKALSNYMKSLLQGVGIESIYTLVYAGENALKLDREFSSNQFNHAILCVPLKKDTLWLECTNQQMPCGYLGKFTDDRDVLLIKEDGGEIAHTKPHYLDDNILERSAEVNLELNGNGLAQVFTKYNGLRYNQMFPLLGMDDVDKKKYVLGQINIPNFNLNSFDHENIKARVPRINENLNIKLRNYTSLIGNRLILPLNLMNKYTEVPTYLRNRESDVIVRRSYKDMDTITYIIPENCNIEEMPAPISIKSPFGYYEASAYCKENSVVYTRLFYIKKGHYSTDLYNSLREFYKKISVADDMKCLLKIQ